MKIFDFFKKSDADETKGEGFQHNDAQSQVELPFSYPEEVANFCKDHLQKVLDACSFDTHVVIERKTEQQLYLNITGEEDSGRIIGRDGATLSSLQTLIRASVMRRFQMPVKVMIDVGDYRKRKRSSVRSLALKAAQAVIRDQKQVALEPMSSEDRLQIHTLFQGNPTIKTYSQGEGAQRHVVLTTPSDVHAPVSAD